MAAATVDTVSSKIQDPDGRMVDSYVREINENNLSRGIVLPYANTEDIASTSVDDIGDIVRISHKFPSGTYLWDFSGTPSDLDGGAALVYDIIWIDTAGATVLTIVSGSTKGQAASGTDVAAAAARGRLVGEGYVAFKTTTASAVPAAGSYNFALQFSIGLLCPKRRGPGDSGIYLKDARA